MEVRGSIDKILEQTIVIVLDDYLILNNDKNLLELVCSFEDIVGVPIEGGRVLIKYTLGNNEDVSIHSIVLDMEDTNDVKHRIEEKMNRLRARGRKL
ncbi:hypothetical protein BHU72_11690 [Desulfuribacillus stibiiarsenatis]|uniref:DUF3006 domain-containing protein n=1 Tax=Desulfuribacillus stibiiarsenatis TaxID=1390249 RepID=A0A1E5L7Q5_9FIRM|nr:hypothetical protein [Desulfuribacillus stibiiarsenatis]OEH86192.1 hypothetical protein BHU72_11690 [Desulfuribacillus stibiiarsenatis]